MLHEHVCLKETGHSLRNNTTVLDLWTVEVGGLGFKKTHKQLLVSTGLSCCGKVCSSTAPHCGVNEAKH